MKKHLPNPHPDAPLPIILDTDIGDDIDDALALTVALNSPEVEIVGVTTVFRDAGRRAILARKLLELMGRQEVPVFAGCSQPLLPDWDNFPGGQAVGRQFETLGADEKWSEPRHAVDFLIETARSFAAQNRTLTIVTIGALTNAALALRLAPDIVPSCRIVMMGGKWGDDFAEWNILCDPEAAAMVFGSGVELTMVGLDVTLRCVLNKEQEAMFHASPHPHARFLGQLIDLWGHPVTLHDPLTVLTLFSDVVRFEPRRLSVGLHGDKVRARTQVLEGEPNVSAAVEVDVERAKSLFLERALRGPEQA